MSFLKQKDFLYPLFLCFVVCFFIGLNYYSFGHFVYDCGREFIVPEAIRNGNIPIKDIFLSYFPLSYQINALLFKIFGASLDVLRISGIFASCGILILVYFISKEFTNSKKAFIVALIIAFVTMFNVSNIANYVLSYSYAFIYGVFALFVSLFFGIKFIKENKFLYLSFFFLGTAFALKAEFIFVLIPYFIMLIYKKCSFKNWFFCGILYVLPIVLSFGVLFVQGFNFKDLIGYFVFLKSFLNSEILKIYSASVFLKNPVDWFLLNIKNFIYFSVCFLAFLPFFYLKEKFNKKWLSPFCNFLPLFLIFVLSVIKGDFSAGNILSWLIFPLVYILIVEVRNKNFELVFLALCALGLAFRFNFIYSNSYLAYTMPVALLVVLIYFASNKAVIRFFLIFALANVLYFTISNSLFSTHKIETQKGKMQIVNADDAKTINDAINFLNKTKKDAEILVLPEGGMFNFLLNKKTNLRFYQLIPNHIESLGEENIITSLKNSPPNYILILNTDYSIYGTPKFCTDFGQKICKFVGDNYIEVKTFKNAKSIEIKAFQAIK